MNIKKKIFFIILIIILALLVYVFAPDVASQAEWNRAVKAAGSMPYQIGLTKVIIIPCFTVGPPPACSGGTLCLTKDPATCTLYSDVSGTPAGGMGSNALFLKTAITMAGLTPGGQLIAGGMSPVLMDSGVLASAGGCSGCMARAGTMDKIKNWFNNFIIAGSDRN